MRTRENILFATGDLSALLDQNLRRRVSPAVDEISKDQLLATPIEDVIEHIYQKLAAEPLQLYEDQTETTESETKIDVSGDPYRYIRESGPFYVPAHEVQISIPYTGEHVFWTHRPSSWKTMFPHGDVTPPRGATPGKLVLTYAAPIDSLNEERLANEIQQELSLVRFYVDASSKEVESYNSRLRESIKQHIEARKARTMKTEGLASRLGLPLKRNPDAPPAEPIKLTRKLIKPLPPPPSSGYEPEPGIDDETYEHILSVIRHELRTMETTPKTYQPLGEEDLRNVLLAHLNGHYQGDATGETFRSKGKTDIRIEDDNRAAFVGECKIWGGPKVLSDAMDQLLGYLTWRDCKAAVVVYNKAVSGFTELLAKVPAQLREHAQYKGALSDRGHEGEWRFRFRSTEDEARQITVHVFLANLFVST